MRISIEIEGPEPAFFRVICKRMCVRSKTPVPLNVTSPSVPSPDVFTSSESRAVLASVARWTDAKRRAWGVDVVTAGDDVGLVASENGFPPPQLAARRATARTGPQSLRARVRFVRFVSEVVISEISVSRRPGLSP
jgi:hypothetical protein